MLDVYIWSVLITGLLFSSFGVVAVFKNVKDRSAKFFGLLSLGFALWSYPWFFLLLTKSGEVERALFFARLLNLGATIIPVFFLHWVSTIVSSSRISRRLLILCYVVSGIFILISFSELYIPAVEPILFFNFWPVAGPLYTLFLVIGYLGFVAYAVYVLIDEFRNSIGYKKYQLGFVIAGSVSGFLGGATNFPLMYGYLVQPFGIIATMSTPFLLGYAALNYNLMNTKAVATQYFVAALNILLFINFLKSDTLPGYILNGIILGFVVALSYFLISSNTSERKAREKIERLAKELERANERLKELDQMKSEFVSLASHQIRGPLTAIKGYASEIVEGDFGELPKYLDEPMRTITQSCESLILIVEDFLNVSRIEQGKMRYEIEDFSAGAVTEEVINELRPVVSDKGLKLTTEIDQNVLIKADKGKFKQIVSNIVDNAVKYTPKGDVVVKVKRSGENMILSVSDTGLGISQKTMSKLFQKFSRAEDATKANIKGTGLGLYVASQMMKALDGHIWAESEGEGHGSTFFIELKAI